MDKQAVATGAGATDRPTQTQPDLEWLKEELQNILYLAERAGMQATARDLRFAIRSAEVELRQGVSWKRPPYDDALLFLRDARREAP